jgi:hypothetical protein
MSSTVNCINKVHTLRVPTGVAVIATPKWMSTMAYMYHIATLTVYLGELSTNVTYSWTRIHIHPHTTSPLTPLRELTNTREQPGKRSKARSWERFPQMTTLSPAVSFGRPLSPWSGVADFIMERSRDHGRVATSDATEHRQKRLRGPGAGNGRSLRSHH